MQLGITILQVMEKLIYLLILCFGLTFNTQAQDNIFTVLSLKGDVTYGEKKLATGQIIKGDNALVIGSNSYVGLIHKSGKPVELKAAGTYQMDKLIGMVKESDGNFSSQFVAYLGKEMGGSDDGNYQSNMTVTGSVERAMKHHGILIALPQKTTLIDSNFNLSWMDTATSKNYQVKVYDMVEDVVYETTSTTNNTSLDLSSVSLEEEEFYIVEVLQGKRVSNRIHLYIPNADEKADLNNQIAGLNNSSMTVIEKIAAAKFLASLGLHIEASAMYSSALKKDENDAAKNAFEHYLTSYNIR